MQERTSSWQWTPVAQRRNPPGPLMRCSSSKERGEDKPGLFSSLRRSFRERGPFSGGGNALFRLPGTPRLARRQQKQPEREVRQQVWPSPVIQRRGNRICKPPKGTPSEDAVLQPADLSDSEPWNEPPSADEARDNLYSRLEALLTPATHPPIFPKRRQNLLFPSGAQEVSRIAVDSSQESLMSLMSASAFGASSPIQGRSRKNPRSVSSNSSRGSFPELALRKPPLSCRSFPHSVPDAGRSGRRASAISGSSCSSAVVCSTSLPVELKIRPLFDLESSSGELDSPFLGREWLFREIHDSLLRTGNGRLFAILGSAGVGRTTFMKHIVRLSPFHKTRGAESERRGSMDSGIASGSRLSLNHSVQTSHPCPAKALASRVVSYHFCRIECSETCAVPEFVCHLGAQLALSPLLNPYAEFLSKNTEVQDMLDPEQCRRQDPVQVFKTAISQPLNQLKAPESGPLIMLIDGLEESEFHKSENNGSLASFLVHALPLLPNWIQVVATMGPDGIKELNVLESRRVRLDEADLDQRIRMDAKSYVEYRLHSEFLQDQVLSTTGLPENLDPINHFSEHIVSLSRGNLLYLRLTLDLLERGQIRLRTSNYGAVPISLQEVYLLIFNLKFNSVLAFDRVIPILSLMLAALAPMTAKDLHAAVNAGRFGDYVTWEDFCDRMLRLEDFLIQRSDDTYVFFHNSFREWLQKRDGRNTKFLADLRQGHILHALWKTRRGDLDPEEMFELGHHILKSHPYKHLRPNSSSQTELASGRDCQIVWLQQSAKNIRAALTSSKNTVSPNTKVSRLLLIAGASPNTSLPDGAPLICRAAEMGQVEMASLLIEFQADRNAREPLQNRTPLMLAAAKGHLDLVQLLHQHRAQLGLKDKNQKTALVHAGEAGQVSVVSFLLQCDWGDEKSRKEAIKGTFVQAARCGETKVCEFLLEMAEVDVEDVDPASGETALCAACGSAQAETAQYLMSRGASMQAAEAPISTPQKSPLETVCESETTPPLICAVAGGSWEIVSGLLARGLDANNETDSDGTTPLMVAAKHGHIGVLELLLSRGANVDAVDYAGRTALLWACLKGQGGCAALLLDRGSNVDARDGEGESGLHLAAESGDKHLVQILLERGAKFEVVNSKGMRPIDVSVKRRNTAALQCFLRRGAKLGSVTWELAEGCPEIIVMLLQKLHDDASLLYERGRLKDAAHRYSYALKKLPVSMLVPNPAPHSFEYRAIQLRYAFNIGLGRCKRRSGEINAAIQLCEEAVNTTELLGGAKEKGFEAYFLRARCKFDLQDIHGARGDAEEAVNLLPSSREARQLLQSLTIQQHSPPTTMTTVVEISSPHPVLLRDTKQKSRSPAECSSDSGNQADFEEGTPSLHI